MAADPMKPLSLIFNGTPVTVADPDPRETLLDYLRSPEIGLIGAKASCGEGGCGACTVLLARYEQGSPRTQGWGNIVAGDDTGVVVERPVNACLTPLCSLDGAAVTTIEGLADERGAPHPIALRLAEKNGSQCGYCSPGWVISMHALLRREPRPTQAAIEDAFDGHICRCTGYRAILDAMQSFEAERGDADRRSLCAHRPVAGTPWGAERKAPGPACYHHGRDRWRRVVSLAELGEAWLEARRDKLAERLRLVAGNTAAPLDKEPGEKPRFIIDISAIPELNVVEDGRANGSRGLILGGTVTIARTIAELGSRATDLRLRGERPAVRGPVCASPAGGQRPGQESGDPGRASRHVSQPPTVEQISVPLRPATAARRSGGRGAVRDDAGWHPGLGAAREFPQDRRPATGGARRAGAVCDRRGDRRRRPGGAPAAERQAAGERRLAP